MEIYSYCIYRLNHGFLIKKMLNFAENPDQGNFLNIYETITKIYFENT